MNRVDHAVIGGLVLVLALIAAVVGLPAIVATSATPSASVPSLPPVVPYREGTLGRPVSVNPLAARTQVDRDLVALTFDGLVRLGPDGMLVPDLASHWTTDETGKTWTFTLRADARWHDGQPVTAADVAFTVDVLRDAAYTGPGAGSWREVTATVIDEQTIRFDLATPLGGFLQLATQPIAPAHLLSGIPVDALATDPFGRDPVGSGPLAIVELDDDHATLEPAAASAPPPQDPVGPGVGSAKPPGDALVTPSPTKRPSVAQPRISRFEFRFFDDQESLESAFRAGEIDAVSGLAPAAAAALAADPGTRTIRYPGTTLTAVALNLRPDHPELRDPAVRRALLAAIDPGALIADAYGGLAAQADSPIPSTSWAFDPAASAPVAYDAGAAGKALAKAGWKKVDDHWRPPGAKDPYTLELLAPPADSNPTLRAAAERIAADWTALGLTVALTDADPATLLTDHLQPGTFSAAIVDVSIGHDPDLYPLLASSQTQTGGLNVIGVQDATLDGLLIAARRPGTDEARKAAYTALETQLTANQYVLPIAFADEVVVVKSDVQDVVPQPVGDPSDRFWDVLTWRLANDR